MADSKVEIKAEAPKTAETTERPLTPAELLALREALAKGSVGRTTHAVESALEEQARAIDQRQEQQLYASTWAGWSGVVAAITATTNLDKDNEHRKSMDRIREQMFELLAKEEKKRRMRDSPFFQQLVSILGESAAESIAASLEKAGGSASGLQANKEALTQAAKDIAATLDRAAPHLLLSMHGERLASAIEGEMARAVDLLPKSPRVVPFVRPDDTLAVSTHDKMFALKTGEERLLELQKVRASLGGEKFAAMLDAYDRKYGVPLVAHITAASSSTTERQAEMLHETRASLTSPQKERLLEFGRAEYAQSLAVFSEQRQLASQQLPALRLQVRTAEQHLARALGDDSLVSGPTDGVREKLLTKLSTTFPQLKGKSWEDAALKLKEVAGEKDDKVAERLIRKLVGASGPVDTAAVRETATRATIHMQKVIAVEQQIDGLKSVLSGERSPQEKLLKEHYSKVFGTEATKDSPTLVALERSAEVYLRHLKERISDPNITSTQRERLLVERDSIEFSVVRKLVATALESNPPQVQNALGALNLFMAQDVGSEKRRSQGYMEAARAIAEAVSGAEALRQQWQGLDISEGMTKFKADRGAVSGARLCIDGRPKAQPEINLTERFAQLKSTTGPLGIEGPKPTKHKATMSELEVVREQRTAALSTKWFSQILDTGGVLETGIVPAVTPETAPESGGMPGRIERLNALRGEMDSANARTRGGLLALDKDPASGFVRSEHLKELKQDLSPETLKKLGVASPLEAVARVSTELDHTRNEMVVTKESLLELRAQVKGETPMGKVLAAVPTNPTSPQQEYQDIRGRLTHDDLIRLDTFLGMEVIGRGAQAPESKPSWSGLLGEKPEILLTALPALIIGAKHTHIERMLEKLSDAEHEEFLAFFEATTRQSIGRSLTSALPLAEGRPELLLKLAGSRVVSSTDIERFYSGPVPKDRAARVEALLAEYRLDRDRRTLDLSLVKGMADSVRESYSALRVAAGAAASSNQPQLVSEITGRMRAIEAQLNGKIAQTLSSHEPSYSARQGYSSVLRATVEHSLAEALEKSAAPTSSVAGLARDVAEMLRSDGGKVDAAFNRIRQQNLSEENTLLLKALYAHEVSNGATTHSGRTLSGDLSRDLLPPKVNHSIEATRVSKLMVGGPKALAEYDVEVLKVAAATKNEKLQLETLSNLRATDQYKAVQDKVPTKDLAPAAQNYHQAVTSGDKLKADVADVKIKAQNKDLKPADVANFVQGKSSVDLERAKQLEPDLRQSIKLSNPEFFDDRMLKVLSANESERKKAIEYAMRRSLTDPTLFAHWLNVAPTQEARVEALRNLEKFVSTLSTAPKFVTTGDPTRDESKIVQYVRAQKTDFREIDAYLINGIIVATLSTGTALKPEVLEQIQALRLEAAAQLSSMDAYAAPREKVVGAARDILSTYEGYKILERGDPVLRDGTLNKEERRARVQELWDRYPMLTGRPESLLARGETGTRWNWYSGYMLDPQIAATDKRIVAQRALLAPMERGLKDIHQTRELMRATFGLRAKDTATGVFQGLTSESTQYAMGLLQQRDAKVVYQVMDRKEHEEWLKVVSKTADDLATRDRYTSWGLTAGKIIIVAAVAVTPLGPAGAFVCATALNFGDKWRRRVFNGEDIEDLAKDFIVEFAIDVASVALSYYLTSYILSTGKYGTKIAGEQIKVEAAVRTERGPVAWLKRLVGGKVEEPIKLRPGGDIVRPWDVKSLPPSLQKLWYKAQGEVIKRSGGETADSLLLMVKHGPMGTFRVETEENKGASLQQSAAQVTGLDPNFKPINPNEHNQGQRPKPELPEFTFVVNPEPNGPLPPPPLPPPLPAPVEPPVPPPTPEPTVPVVNVTPPAPPPPAGDPNAFTQTASVSFVQPTPPPTTPTEPNSPAPPAPPAGGGAPSAPPPPVDLGTTVAGGGQNPPTPPAGPAPGSGGGDPKEPPPGEPPGRGILAGPRRSASNMSDGDEGGSKNRTGMPGPQIIASTVIAPIDLSVKNGTPQSSQIPFPNQNRASTSIGLAGPQPHIEAVRVPNPIAQPNSSAVTLEELLAASQAATRAEVQASLMQNAATQAIAASQADKRGAEKDQVVSKVANKDTLVAKKLEGEAIGEREASLVDKRTAEALSERVRERQEVRLKEQVAQDERLRSGERQAVALSEENRASEARLETARAQQEQVEKTVALSEASQPGRVEPQIREEFQPTLNAAQQSAPTVNTVDIVTTSHETRLVQEVAAPNLGLTASVSQERESSITANASRPTLPAFIAPQATKQAVPMASDGGDGQSDSDVFGGASPKRKGVKAKGAQSARMRELIIQQLMTQHQEKARREKLLRALIELGISEQEYRALVTKLGEMEVARLSQQQAERRKFAEPIAIAREVPTLKEPTATPQKVGEGEVSEPKPAQTTPSQTSRAEIYKRLKAETSTRRKSA